MTGLTGLEWVHFQGRVYRAHNPHWAHSPSSGEGAARHGGRFNRTGTPALYTSLDPMTAWMEAQQAFVFKPQPMTLVAYDVDCKRVADLTQPTTLSILGLAANDLACAWEDLADRGETPPTWQVSARLIGGGAHGAIVPSHAPGTRQGVAGQRAANVVFWQSNGECRVEAIDDFGRLARWS